MDNLTITLDVGGAEYDLDEASVPIQDLIDTLEEAREDGATHVAIPSGNHRGARWLSFSTEYGWADD